MRKAWLYDNVLSKEKMAALLNNNNDLRTAILMH